MIPPTGMGIAEVICYPISIWISSSFSGWPISYYTYCAFSAIVLIVFMIFVYDDPEDDPFISNNELIYLKSFNDTDSPKDTYNVPFCDLMTSTAVWSIIIGFTVYVITVVFILTEAPVFASLILGFDTKNIGLITSISAILEYIVTILSGICADIIIRRKYLNVINTRKMFMILTTGIPALCMFCIGYFNEIVSMTLLTLSFGCIGSYTTSIMTNIIEVSKERSEVIMGIMSFTGHGAAFIIILLFGMLIQDGNTASQWSLMFRIISAINLFGMIFFLMFAKAEQLTKSDVNITKQEMKSYKTIKD
ncbi:sodium-dependent phosphate transport protein 3-like [Antedon mediterranea]|uniref:sodium-dependent phosphate transport protein 3-like n=1 Tax=Antedon mediterranea TaxID=105859 RepID=UPI003AF5F9D7